MTKWETDDKKTVDTGVSPGREPSYRYLARRRKTRGGEERKKTRPAMNKRCNSDNSPRSRYYPGITVLPGITGHLRPCFPETGKVIPYRRLNSGVKQVSKAISLQPKPKTQPKPKPQPRPKATPNLYQNRLSVLSFPPSTRWIWSLNALSSLGAGLSLPAHAFEIAVVDDGSPPPLQETGEGHKTVQRRLCGRRRIPALPMR